MERGAKSQFNPINFSEPSAKGKAWWDPRAWSKSQRIWIGAGTAVVIIVAVVVAVVEYKKNRYPSYSKLNYSLSHTYSGTTFFDQFDYFTGYDPSSGFVHYVNREGCEQQNLTYAGSSSAVLRVDTSDTDASTGRYSARIHSKVQYESGLFIFDVLHSPYGCATWPALWLTDANNWPENGEIDVMEAVNKANTGNQVTLHTSNGCKMNVKRKETGTVQESNCWNGTNDNSGCGVKGVKASYGQKFNENGGGVYAMELRDAGIRVWMFERGDIPSDISNSSNSSTPDPSSWGTALADFPSTNCDISSHFKNQSIIVNIDLCGDWAGATSVYDASGCPSTCEELVTSNATNFETAYWEFKSFKVYTSS